MSKSSYPVGATLYVAPDDEPILTISEVLHYLEREAYAASAAILHEGGGAEQLHRLRYAIEIWRHFDLLSDDIQDNRGRLTPEREDTYGDLTSEIERAVNFLSIARQE